MKVFWLITFLHSCLFLCSQSYYTRHFTSHNGLPSNYVYAVVQDHLGYIWFATDNGVSRFDGKRFRNFASRDGLPDNDVFELKEDACGRMWLSCFSNHRCYIYQNKVYTVENDTALKKLSSDTYCSFTTFRDRLIISLQPPVPAYQASPDGKIAAIPARLPAIAALKDYLLTASPYGGSPYFYLLDASYKVLDSLLVPPDLKKVDPFNPLLSVCATGHNSFMFQTQTGNNPSYEVFESKLKIGDTLHTSDTFVALYREGNTLWMNKGMEGILALNTKLQRDPSVAPLFRGNAISRFMIDREGNYWGCTLGQGVYQIPNNAFRYHFNSKELRKQPVKITAAGPEICVGFDNGSVQELRSGRLYSNLTNPYASIPFTKPYCMQSDSARIILSRPDGIITIHRGTGRQEYFPAENVKWFSKTKDHFLIGNLLGASLLFPDGRQEHAYLGRTTTVYEQSNGNILAGTINGLRLCRKNSAGKWTQESLLPGVLDRTRISCLGETEGVLLVGTVQKGLLLVKGNEHAFARLEKGPADINCSRLFIDAGNTIWIASFEGLFRLRLDSGIHNARMQRISAFNGLLSNIVSDLAVVNDTVYAVSPEGITSFPAAMFNGANKESFPVYIDAVLADGQLLDPGHPIILAPDVGM